MEVWQKLIWWFYYMSIVAWGISWCVIIYTKTKITKPDAKLEIIIGRDRILTRKHLDRYEIITPDGFYGFSTLKEAKDYYCENLCNPRYNKAHYDCESCPIKLKGDDL